MKISLNLATLSSPRDRYAIFWAAPLALLGAVGLVALGFAALSNFEEYRKFQASLDQVSQQEQELASREKDLQKELDQPGERAVFQKAHFVNNLIQERQLTLTGLTQRASRLLPPTVRLSSLAVARPKEGVLVRFTVVGNDERGLEAFMGNLEDSPDFEDMTVTNQKLQQTSSATGQLGVTCTVRYVGAGAR